MLDFSKYKFFYVNGCSFTEGGGLEEPKIRDKSLRPFYEKYYNVTWKNRLEVNWAGRLSQISKIPVNKLIKKFVYSNRFSYITVIN